MQEFWFCASCKSMNRASSQQCYRCKARKTEATLATVANRQQDVVLTPGLDEEHREVAWTLMFRQKYISAWKLGYLAAGLIFATLAVSAFAAVQTLVIVIVGDSLRAGGPNEGQLALLGVTGLASLGVGVLMVVVHSVFLCLTSMNAPALGSGSPRFDPARAAVWWIESALWAIRGGLAFVIPPMLAVFGLLIGGLIFGLAIGVVWSICAFWLLGDPVTNLGKPKRLLADLWDRLGVPGSANSRTVTLWSFAWGTARGIAYLVSAMLFLSIFVLAFAGLFIEFTPVSQDQTALVGRLITDFVLIVEFVADGIGLYLLAQVTIELARRQRTREEWVLRGMDDAKARAYADSQVRDAAVAASAPQQAWTAPPPPAWTAPPPPAWTAPSVPDATPPVPGWTPSSQQPAPVDHTGDQTFSANATEIADEQPGVPDRPVMQPSSSAMGRYRAPLGGAEADRPVETPPTRSDDLDLGSGI
jgi:hypothetical protein